MRMLRKRYKNVRFLKALGWQCRLLRVMKGLSVQGVANLSKNLSPASIDRLERGTADVQITVLLRYAQAIDVPLHELLDFKSD